MSLRYLSFHIGPLHQLKSDFQERLQKTTEQTIFEVHNSDDTLQGLVIEK